MALTASELKEKITKLEKGIASPAINEDQKKGLRTALDTYKSQLSKLEASENTEKEETKPASEPEKKKEKSDSAKVGTNKKGAGRPAGSKKKSTENKKEEEKPAEKSEEKPAEKPKERTQSGLTEKECEELLAKAKASRKKAKAKVAKRVAQGLPAAKTVTETVKKTAKTVENKVRQTKVVTPRQAASVAKEIVVMVKNVLKGIKVQRERQKFVTDICKNLTSMAKSAKKFEDGGDVSDDESHREGDYPFAKGGNTNQASEQTLFNFLVEDLNKLSKEIENGDKEGVERFFSYWRAHLEKLNPSKEKIDVEFAKGGEIGDDEIAEIFVEGHPYYISKMGDSTHFKMSNSREGDNPHGGAAMVSHVGQHSDRSYIDDVKSWLKGGKSPEGKKYANWGLRYENGGDVMNPPDSQGQEYGVGNFEFGKGGKVNGDEKIIAYYNELRYRVNVLDGEELYLAGNNSVSSDIEDSVPADEGVGLETMKKYAIKTGKEMAKERGAKFVGAEYEAIEDEDDYAKGGLLDSDYKEVVDSYLVAALWSSDNDATGEPFDAEYGIYDFTDNARKEITKVVKKFVDNNLETIKESELDMSQVGHDLWLTRNGHGVGFWDRGLPKAIGDKLTANAKKLGESMLYVDKDGKVAVDGKYENGGMTDGVNANNINEEIRNALPKDGEVKGVTEIIIENNGETLLYGTKTRKTQMSFKRSTVEEIKEEIKFTKDILARSKRDIETFDSEMASLQNSPTFTRKDREMAVKLHNGSILNVLHDEKIVIPYLEKLMEIKKRNKS